MTEDQPRAPFAERTRALRAVNRLNGSFRSQAVAERMAGFTAFDVVGTPTGRYKKP